MACSSSREEKVYNTPRRPRILFRRDRRIVVTTCSATTLLQRANNGNSNLAPRGAQVVPAVSFTLCSSEFMAPRARKTSFSPLCFIIPHFFAFLLGAAQPHNTANLSPSCLCLYITFSDFAALVTAACARAFRRPRASR